MTISWSKYGGFQGINDFDIAAWNVAYPSCYLDRQLAAMNQWLLSNPSKSHRKLWRRFITNWLSRAQEKGGDTQSRRPLLPGDKSTSDRYWEKMRQEKVEREKAWRDGGSKSFADYRREEKKSSQP